MDKTDANSSTNSSVQNLPQILVINPKNALVFKGPSTQPTTVQITLTNPANKWVAFKVKTTAPRRYCVRPNGGIIKGGDTMPVNIVYQPGDTADPSADRARHKFLVQAIFVDNDQVNLEQVWRDVPKDRLMESKIRCIFEDMEPGDGNDKQPPPYGTVHVGAGASLSLDPELVNNNADSQSSKTRQPEQNATGSSDLELRRLAEDYRRAQDEIANLRDENRRLRDDGVRIRKSLQSVGQTSSGGTLSSSHRGNESKDLVTLLKTDLPQMHILLALLTAVLVGAIISQFIF